MISLSILQSALALRLGWTIVHSLWQLLAIALILCVCLPALRRRSAQSAYLACCGSLGLCCLVPLITFLLITAPTDFNGLRIDDNNTAAGLTPLRFAIPDHPISEFADADLSKVNAQPNQSPSQGKIESGPILIVEANPQNVTAMPKQSYVRLSEQLCRALPAIVAIWFVGVILLSIWNCSVWFAVQRLKVSSNIPVTRQIEQTAIRLSRELGVTQAVRLFQSTFVDSPVVIGLWKPVILLPISLVLQLPPDQLEALLAHELAHIRRHDYLINLLQTVIETLMFYHPAIWWISNQLRREREHCCDDLVLQLNVKRVVYVQALAAIAGARAPASLPAATGGQLIQRLQRIMGIRRPESIHSARWLAGAALLSLCCLAVGLCAVSEREILADDPVGKTKSQSKESADSDNKDSATATDIAKLLKPTAVTSGSMRITVTGPDGTRVPDAKIHVSVWTDDKDFKSNQHYQTDANGLAEVNLPKTVHILRIWASKARHRTKFHQWWPEKQSNVDRIPAEFGMSMEKGTTIGGIVKNADGQPIAGVQVQVWGLATGDPNTIDGSLTTDQNGRWVLENVPADKTDVQILLTHPDYISDEYFGGLQKEQNITIAALRDQTATLVMPAGTTIEGKIVTLDGRPIEKAVVIWGDNPYFQTGSQEVLTDAEGRYRLPTLRRKPIRITVVAKDWAPDSRIVNVGEGMSPVDFQLHPGKMLRIRFVDGAGEPLKGVHISVDKWRKASALYNARHPNVTDTHIPDKTNEDGIFEWSWAPDDGVSYNFYKDGFSHTSQDLVASEATQTVVMNRSTTISGTVRDAQTGKKIENFKMIAINYYNERFLGLERMNERPCSNGEFAYEMTRTDLKQGIQIEAPGYRTFRSPRRYQSGSNSDLLDVRLHPVKPFTGLVISPSGVPVSNARVHIASEYDHQQFYNLDGDRGGGSYKVKANASGEFEVIPQSERYLVIVVSDEGYGEAHRSADQIPGEIRLKPWAKLTGQLLQAGQPLAKQQVSLAKTGFVSSDEPNYSNRQNATTDENGMFTFDRVAPVACHVEANLHFSVESALKSSRTIPLDPKPGETLHVVLGGEGAQISGQLVVEGAPADFDYHFSLSYLLAKRPGITVPESLAQKGFDWRNGWSDSWRGTQEGIAYLDTLHHWFVKPDPDGKINIFGVEPGEYELAINLYGTTEGCLVHPMAQRVIPITVQPGQKTIDMGKVMIPSIPVPQAGDLAGDFQFVDTKGQQTSLSAERGKYVLLDFWASWCGPCMAKLPDVEQLRKRYESNNSLIVIGANLDDDSEQARSAIKSKELNWKHALLGDWSKSNIPRQFGVSSLPTYVLVDPAGKIAIHSHSLKDVEDHLNVIGVK